jgi:hypothetical protein
MRRLAAKGHPRAGELRKAALDYERALDSSMDKPSDRNMKRFLGLWARAQRIWSECSGEPLI